MSGNEALDHYLHRYFLPLPDIAARSALPRARVEALVEAGALPRPSYSLWPNGAFSSPIGGAHGPAPAGAPIHFHSPAAIWWARRAGLSPAAPESIAARFRAQFVADFLNRLRAEPLGPLGYPAAYIGDVMDETAAAEAAASEWADWIDGSYGVCLRFWDAHHAITKTCQRGLVVALTDDGEAHDLPAETLDRLLIAMQALNAVMLPFAPHQRPHGTPGLWLDRILERFGLGYEQDAAAPSLLP